MAAKNKPRGSAGSPASRTTCLAAFSLLLLSVAEIGLAQVAPQPFLAPPRLAERSTAELRFLRAAEGVPTGACRPNGDITHDLDVINVRRVALRFEMRGEINRIFKTVC
jgi:hypothetical protein